MAALTSSETPFEKTPKAQQEVAWEIAGCLVFLIGALAVARDEVLQALVANRAILRFLFVLTANASTPAALLDEMHYPACFAVSEDSLEFGQALVGDQETCCYSQLLKIKDSGGFKAMLACGVLHNVYLSRSGRTAALGIDDASDAILVPAIAKVLDQTSREPSDKAESWCGAGRRLCK